MRVSHGKITRRSRNLRDQRACAQVNRPDAMKFRHGLGAVFACSVRFRVQKKRPGLRHPIKVNQGESSLIKVNQGGKIPGVRPARWGASLRVRRRGKAKRVRQTAWSREKYAVAMNLNALVGRRRRAEDCTPYRPQICHGTRLVGRVTPCAPRLQPTSANFPRRRIPDALPINPVPTSEFGFRQPTLCGLPPSTQSPPQVPTQSRTGW